MSRLTSLYGSTIGKKGIAAVTGVLLLGFLVLHVIGNLKVFVADPQPGVPDIDVYARFLRTMGEPLLPHATALWLVRGVLITALVLHVTSVFSLALRNQRARPVKYLQRRHTRANLPARWMLVTGSLIAVFVVVHILQFTTGSIDSAGFVQGAVYANLHRAFQLWYFVVLYVGAMVVIAFHLYHGAWSLFQTLGADDPDRNRGLRHLAVVVAAGLFLSFSSVPVAFALGWLPPPPIQNAAASSEAGE